MIFQIECILLAYFATVNGLLKAKISNHFYFILVYRIWYWLIQMYNDCAQFSSLYNHVYTFIAIAVTKSTMMILMTRVYHTIRMCQEGRCISCTFIVVMAKLQGLSKYHTMSFKLIPRQGYASMHTCILYRDLFASVLVGIFCYSYLICCKLKMIRLL